MPPRRAEFDPRAILAGLERSYVDYVVIGGLAQVLRGADHVTAGVDICPSFTAGRRAERLRRSTARGDQKTPRPRHPTLVASVGDLARMAAALDRDQDLPRLGQLRRIMELEANRGRTLSTQLHQPASPAAPASSADDGRRTTR
jgi:hypothetical protein